MSSIALYLFFSVVLVSLIWRLASKRYSLPCPSWLAWLVEHDNPFAKVHRAASIVVVSGVKPGMTVLDAGCGPGRVTIPLAKTVGSTGRVVALDLQQNMLDRVKLKADAEKITWIEFQNQGLGSGKLPKDHFDKATLITVLGEIPNPSMALAEIYHSLKTGGTITIAEIIFDPHFLKKSRVIKLAKTAGFELQKEAGSWYAYSLVFIKI